MKRKWLKFGCLLMTVALSASVFGCRKKTSKNGDVHASEQKVTDSPDWLKALPSAQKDDVTQIFVVSAAGMEKTTATVTMHEKDKDGNWKQIISTPGYVENSACVMTPPTRKAAPRRRSVCISLIRPSVLRMIQDVRSRM